MHVVKNQVSSGLESVNDNINEVQLLQYNLSETRAEAQEQREKENRRNNVVLYNIPESNGARRSHHSYAQLSQISQRIWLPWFFNSTVEFANPENPALNRASKTCNNFVQKLTEKVLKLLNYLGGNCTNNCLGNQSWSKILGGGGKLRGLGGKFPPQKVPG